MRSVFGPATIVLPERLPIRVPSAFPFPTTWAATNPEGISVVTASSTSVSFDVFSTAPVMLPVMLPEPGYLSIEVIDYSARRGIQLLIREILSLYVSGSGHLCSSPPYISNLSLQDCVVACHELQSDELGLLRSCSLYVRLNSEEAVGQRRQYAWQLCNKQVGHLQPVQWIYRVACVQNPWPYLYKLRRSACGKYVGGSYHHSRICCNCSG